VKTKTCPDCKLDLTMGHFSFSNKKAILSGGALVSRAFWSKRCKECEREYRRNRRIVTVRPDPKEHMSEAEIAFFCRLKP